MNGRDLADLNDALSSAPPSDFDSWLIHMGNGKRIPDRKAAELLGMSPTTVRAYRTETAPMPRSVALACSALACGLPAWPPTLQVPPTGGRRTPKKHRKAQADAPS